MIGKQFLQNHPLIYLITDGAATPETYPREFAKILQLVRNAVDAKIDLIQIREKKLPARLVFELVAEAAKITQHSYTKLLVNDRADIAFAAPADGVHLTADSLSTSVIRRNFPDNFIIGVSAHTLFEAERAQREKADFVTFSPVFETPSKAEYGAPQGLDKLKEVCEKLNPFPVVGLGGIDETNFLKVLENGASGFASIRFLQELLQRGDAKTHRFFVELRNEQH